jgi:RNA polymerase sigma-70 factor, ECF subfamily
MDILETIRKAQSGDTQSFGVLYDEFADKIHRFICVKVKNRNQTEDILQETFVKAWQGLPKLKLEDLNFKAWLYKIASNTINDYFRKIYRNPDTLELDESLPLIAQGGPERDLHALYDSELVRSVLSTLPTQYQHVIELRFLQEFSLQETSAILGKSNLATRLTQHRALKLLKKNIQNSHVFQA